MSHTVDRPTTDSVAAMMAAEFGDALAPVYDEMYPDTDDLEAVVDLVAGLTPPPASVLELGVGTGRIALRLARRGFRVRGVDNSPGMLQRLRDKDVDGTVEILETEFSRLGPGSHDVVLAPFNVLLCALTPADQIGMLRTMAEQVALDGRVVVEMFDPSEYHSQLDGRVTAIPLFAGGVVTETKTVVPAVQYLSVVSTLQRPGHESATSSLLMRYLWPAELDLMAGIVGLALESRHPGWNRDAFTGGHSRTAVVSIFRLTS